MERRGGIRRGVKGGGYGVEEWEQGGEGMVWEGVG